MAKFNKTVKVFCVAFLFVMYLELGKGQKTSEDANEMNHSDHPLKVTFSLKIPEAQDDELQEHKLVEETSTSGHMVAIVSNRNEQIEVTEEEQHIIIIADTSQKGNESNLNIIIVKKGHETSEVHDAINSHNVDKYPMCDLRDDNSQLQMCGLYDNVTQFEDEKSSPELFTGDKTWLNDIKRGPQKALDQEMDVRTGLYARVMDYVTPLIHIITHKSVLFLRTIGPHVYIFPIKHH